jgi:hypothetical protein
MRDLDSFHLLTDDEQMRVLERMIADRQADIRARADRYARKISPLTAAPDIYRSGMPSPEVAAVGTYFSRYDQKH